MALDRPLQLKLQVNWPWEVKDGRPPQKAVPSPFVSRTQDQKDIRIVSRIVLFANSGST